MTDTLPKRNIRNSAELSRFVNFGSLQHTDPVIHPDGTVEQTVEYMKDIVKNNYGSVQKIADKLWDAKMSRFLRNVFDFVMNYVQYERDSAFMEQLRLPLRTLSDQKGDCDCMAILIGSLLYAKGVPFKFRIAKYNGRSDYQHVYVVVDRDSGGYTVLDPVIRKFDTEKPFDHKKDFHVIRVDALSGLNGMSSPGSRTALGGMPIQMLNGNAAFFGIQGVYGLYDNINKIASGEDLDGIGLGSDDDDEKRIYRYLVRTRDVILQKPEMFRIMRNPLEVARMLDYAIRYWDTPNRDFVLGVLEGEEQRLLRERVIVYPAGDLTGEELGELGKGFFKKIGQAVKTAVKKVTTGVKKAVKKVGEGMKKAGKKIVQTLKRINPVSVTVRLGMLAAIRINLGKWADKLQYGLYTDEQAQAAGLDMNAFHDSQAAYRKTLDHFTGKLGGKKEKFDAAIRKGIRHRAINGFHELAGLAGNGQLGWIASVVSAVVSIVIALIKHFRKKKNPANPSEEYGDVEINEEDFKALVDENGNPLYDEDGNPISAEEFEKLLSDEDAAAEKNVIAPAPAAEQKYDLQVVDAEQKYDLQVVDAEPKNIIAPAPAAADNSYEIQPGMPTYPGYYNEGYYYNDGQAAPVEQAAMPSGDFTETLKKYAKPIGIGLAGLALLLLLTGRRRETRYVEYRTDADTGIDTARRQRM
jgi:hypothetical protein